MNEKDNHLLTVELSEEQNGNMLDGILNNLPPSPLPLSLIHISEPTRPY